MKELDELRRVAGGRNTIIGAEIYKLCDAIERELAERYMELPLDADGKPWHLGDHTESGDRVRAIGNITIVYDFEENDCDWAHTRTHEEEAMTSELNPYPVGTHLVHWTSKRVKRRIIAYEDGFVWLALDSGGRDSAVRVPVDALERCYKEVER